MQALDARAMGLKDLLHPKERKKKQQMEAQVMIGCIQNRSWMAYFRNDEGTIAPVRDTLNTQDDEDWLGLRFTDYDGPRIRLGVLKVINKSAEAEEGEWGKKIEVPVAGIQEMLTVALFNTKRFDVIEQKRVEDIEKQQTRSDLLDPSPKSIVNMGKVMGAQYLVYGTVNEWNPDRGNKKVGPGGIFSGAKNEAEISITFTLSDVASGQNLFTTTERARMGEWSFGFGGGPGGGATQGTEQKTPVSYAVRIAANKAALKIAAFLRDRKWKGSVVDVKGADVYINAGSQQGMTLETKLSVLAVKGIVKDAESGTVLGEDTRAFGTLEVKTLQNAFSIARVIDSTQKVKTGDRVELATPPVLPPVSPECATRDGGVAP
jgi:curli biogenesis system outer membrane secretion channel CsgG